MKKFIVLLSLVAFIGIAQAQYTTVANENFSSLSGWTVNPTGGWIVNTNLSVSSPSSALGFVPNSNGDSVELISPWYDLRNYEYAFLQFSHICKTSTSDMCQIKYQELSMPGWKVIPTSSYQGTTPAAYAGAKFSHASYSTWIPNDSLATPSNSWWKEENFDISGEVSYAQVRFKFVIVKGNVLGSQFAYGWVIDNFKLLASAAPIKPPVVEFLSSSPADTVYNTGPFTVTAKIATRTYAPIVQPIKLNVSYTYNNITTYDTLTMTMVEGDSIFSAIIPQKVFGTTITYDVRGVDSVGNDATAFSSFYLKRAIGGAATGYVIAGTGTLTQYYSPFYRYYDYGWSRNLYLANELSLSGGGGMITKLAWHVSTTGVSGSNQTCYFQAVNDNSISSNAWIDPATSGATQVWTGTFNPSTTGWVEINLDNPFMLPPGQNLLIYWTNYNGSYTTPYAYWTSTSTSPAYMSVYKYQDGSFPASAGTYNYNRPNARFYVVGGSDDTNSVALYRIESPGDSVVAAPSHQSPVIVTIKNKGIGDLDSCLINWTLNGVPQPTYTWRGNLPDDFNTTDTIGYYTPSVNQYDTLVIWTSLPNGVYDSTTYDDTVTQISFGVTGLNMWLLSNITDTLYNTGPFKVQAHISSRTATPVPTPVYMHVAYTYNSITTYDTILMNYVSNDTFVGIIPQHVFGTAVSYSISVMDAVGNLVTIGDNFVIHRLSGGASTGYVIVGTGTNTQYYIPSYRWYDYSWSRTLYLASELSPTSSGGMITKLAWQVQTTGVSGINQTCYFKEVTDNMMMTTNYITPTSDGATLVWSGTYSPTTTGWVEITLTNSFTLSPNKNLMIYWENNDGVYTSPSAEYSSTTTSNPMAVYNYDDGTFPTYSGSYDYDRPNARFYIIGGSNDDSNSVAMVSIDYPQGSIMATPTGDSVGVKVTIKNKGISNLTSCNVSWELNGVFQGTKVWTGNLTEDFNDTLTVGYYKPRACITDYIRVWVSNPNGVNDPTKYDDTLSTSIYGEAAIEVTLTGPVDTVYHTGPYQIDAQVISLTSLPVDTNVFLNVSYTYMGVTTYDTIRMNNTGNDTLWRTILPQQPYTSHVTYSISATDSLGNIIEIVKWFYVKRPDSTITTDSIILGNVLNGGVFVVPFDCRYAASYSRVIYTGTELGVSTTGAMISSIAWKSYQNAGYTYSDTRTNQAVYMKAVDNTVTAITSGTYVDPITDGAVLVWSGSMNLSATPGEWHKVDLFNPFFLPANKNIIVYFVDQHGTAAATFAWNYYTVTGTSCYGYGTSLSNLTVQSISDYRPWTCFGFSGASSDSDAVATYRILSPENIIPAGVSTPVTVVIKNRGIRNLTSCNIDWTLNGVAQTQYNWTGNLYEDFTDTIVLGNYMPNPANYDNIKVWVSLPNGAADTSNFDDTLSVNAYAQAGLVAEYLPPLVQDTVFVTGPFEILAHIQSTTSIPLPTPVMHLSYTYNNVTTYDTITMSVVHADSIFKATIPQQPFGTYVTYSITVVDSIGSVITISDRFYVKRLSGGSNTGYVIVGTSMNTQYMLPMDMFYRYSWTRQLYLADELNPSSRGGLITELAWEYAYGTPYTYNNQTCYFEEVDASVTSITSAAYVDPLMSGATKVWSGTISLSMGWVNIILDTPFVLSPGKNLLIHWHHNNGSYAGSSYIFYYTPTLVNQAVYCRSDGSFPSGNSGTLTLNRPNARFYIIGLGNDSNSVALTKIISPTDTVPCFQAIPVQVVIENKGIKNLTSCDIHWTRNGVPQTTYQWTGNLAEEFADTIIIGSYTPTFGITDNIKVWVSQPNGVLDSLNYDDTLSKKAYPHYVGGNIIAKAIVEPVNVGAVCFENKTALKVKLKNIGTRAITLFSDPLTFYYTVSGAINLQDSITFANGVFGIAEREFILDSLDISMPGSYAIDISFYCNDDVIHTDDTISMVYDVNKIVMPYDNVFSAATNDYKIINSGSVGWELDSTPAITPMFGTGALHMPSDSGKTSMLKFYSINMEGSNHPTLDFWFSHDNLNSSSQDRVVVKVSTDEGSSFMPVQTVYRYKASALTPQWGYYSVDLLNYAGEPCLIIAFEAISFGGGDMWIDRVLMTSNNEIGVIDVGIADLSELVACDLANKSLKATISNNVNQAIDFTETPITLTLEVSGAVNQVYTRTLATGGIAALSQKEYEVENNFDYSTPGTYYFKAYVNSIDQFPNNDTMISSLMITPDVRIDSIVDIGCETVGVMVYKTVYIKNEGNISASNIPLRLQIDGASDITETAIITLLPGQIKEYTFITPYTVPPKTTYDLSIITELSCDGVKDNDTSTINCCVIDPFVKVKEIIDPSNTPCDIVNTKKYAIVSLENTASKALSNQVVYLEVDNKAGNVEIIKDTILYLPAGLTNYRFVKPYTVPDLEDGSPYTLTSYVYAPVYGVSIEACVETVGITEADGKLWHLGQNIPNPATASTLIPYTIPNEGKLTFKLTTITGQLLHAEDIQGESGTHYYEFNTESIVSGIYYYSMEYKGKKFVKKMTIQK